MSATPFPHCQTFPCACERACSCACINVRKRKRERIKTSHRGTWETAELHVKATCFILNNDFMSIVAAATAHRKSSYY